MYNACKNNKNETIRDFTVFQKFFANSSCKLSFAFRANITTANYNIFVLFAFPPLFRHITEVKITSRLGHEGTERFPPSY